MSLLPASSKFVINLKGFESPCNETRHGVGQIFMELSHTPDAQCARLIMQPCASRVGSGETSFAHAHRPGSIDSRTVSRRPGRENDTLGVGLGFANISSRARALDRDAVSFSGIDSPIRDYEAAVEIT